MKNTPKMAKLEAIKSQVRTHLSEYIGGFRTVKKGQSFNCINPSHPDNDPSCGIVTANQELFHCFSCGIVGDIFTAANLLEGMPLRGPGFIVDNLFCLAKKYGMEVPDLELTADEQHDLDTYRAYSIASNVIVRSPRSERVETKIQEYGWAPKTLEDLGIGGIDSYQSFLDKMTKTYGFDRAFLRQVDLDNKKMFNPDCLLFTVCDEHGQPVGFASRNLLYDSLKQDWERAIEEYGADSEQARDAKALMPSKFINSSQDTAETELKNRIYQKGTRLFGFHQARKCVPPLYIFEGYADCATAYNAGLHNCCAIGATSFTEEHFNMILECDKIDRVICNLDADEAGEKGVDKFVKIVKDNTQIGLKIQILTLPAGMDDPDNFIRKRGLTAFLDVVPTDVFAWELKRSIDAGEDPDTAFERIMPTIVAEPNNLLRLRMAESLSTASGIRNDVVWAEVQRLVDAEGRKIHTELGMVAARTVKLLERSPDKVQEILIDSTRAIERINTMRQGYDLKNLVDYLDEIMNQAEQKKTDGELKTGWPLFDSAFGGIPRSDAFISIPGKPNQGKALAVTARLKTPIGWKLMRDVQVGDGLASIDGAPSVVTGVFPQGVEKTYRVTFSDGRSVVCSGDHLWSVHFVHQYSEGYGDDKHNGWKVFTTDAIRQFCLNGNRKNSHREVFIPLVSGDFGSSESLPLDPWLLGALLGDGGLTEGSPTITKADPYIIDKVRGKVGDLGLDVVLADDKDTFRICHAGRYGLQNPLMETLRLLGLWETDSFTKFIPRQYLDADVESRWQLLQGLMDTDGTAGKTKETSYGTSSPVLAKDVQELVRSLGGICSISERIPTFRGKDGEKKQGALCFDLNIRMAERAALFSLPRKADRVPTAENRQPRLTIKTIEFVGEQETQCITVSHPSKLFITDDYIVTHNSSFLANVAWRLVDFNDDPIVLYHTVDDSMRWFLPRLLGSKYGIASSYFYYAGKHLAENTLVRVYGEKEKRQFREIYTDAKKWFRGMVAAERLLPYDASMLDQNVFALEMRVRDLRKKYSAKPIVVFGDNFHLYTSPGAKEEGEAKTRSMSMACKNLANVHHITLIMTMELPKSALEEGKRPRMMNIKGSAGISYDASANIGIYNDKKDLRNKAELTWWEPVDSYEIGPGQVRDKIERPILEMVFDKSKVNGGFDGNIYYRFNEASGQVLECNATEQEQYRAKAEKQQEWRSNPQPKGAQFNYDAAHPPLHDVVESLKQEESPAPISVVEAPPVPVMVDDDDPFPS